MYKEINNYYQDMSNFRTEDLSKISIWRGYCVVYTLKEITPVCAIEEVAAQGDRDLNMSGISISFKRQT